MDTLVLIDAPEMEFGTGLAGAVGSEWAIEILRYHAEACWVID